jgi:tellurite resistance-related uncharacterized protein
MTRIPEDLRPGLACYKRTRVFSAWNAPWSHLKSHSTGAGVRVALRVAPGRVRDRLDGDPPLSLLVREGHEVVIEPGTPRHLELLDADSTFFIEFHQAGSAA